MYLDLLWQWKVFFAFFLESGFLGILLFGMDRVGKKIHYFATICVCFGAHFSAVWILIANSWMQTPAGYKIEGNLDQARAVITDFWQMVFNPSSVDRIFHVVIGCWVSGAFFVISVAAYYFLKRKHLAIASSMMKIGLIIGTVSLLLQLISGDSSARIVAKYQPEKLAALEGIFETKPYTPISVVGWVDTKKEKVHSLKIPGGLSFLTYRNFQKAVPGLNSFPKEDWPNVAAVFQFYHIMILCWAALFFIAIIGFILWKRKKLERARWFLWIMVFSVLLPQIALQAGWFAAEMGRQPWIVYKVLKTSQGVSTNVSVGQLQGSLTMFTLIYSLLFFLFLFLLDRKIKNGPEELKKEDYKPSHLYRDPYKAR